MRLIEHQLLLLTYKMVFYILEIYQQNHLLMVLKLLKTNNHER
jgi:hypothetical protein